MKLCSLCSYFQSTNIVKLWVCSIIGYLIWLSIPIGNRPLSKCTRRPVSSGNGRDRVTVRCAKYDLRSDAREELEALNVPHSSLELLWVDTVGWDDADLQGKLPLTWLPLMRVNAFNYSWTNKFTRWVNGLEKASV